MPAISASSAAPLVFVFWAVVFLILAEKSSATFNVVCKYNEECQLKGDLALVCAETRKGQNKRCICTKDYIWYERKCITEQELDDKKRAKAKSEDVARVITIIVPIIGALFVVICLGCMCFYWVNSLSKDVQKEVNKSIDKCEEYELDLFDEINERRRSSLALTTASFREKALKPPLKKKRRASLKSETTLSNGHLPNANGKVVKEEVEDKPVPPAPLSSPLLSQKNGYQSSMRRLLTMPQMQSEPGPSRPASANYITNSRPTTARRPMSAAHAGLLKPRPMSSAAGGRAGGLIGPYVSDASLLRARSPVHNPVNPIPKPEDLADLYDKIAEAAEQEEKKISRKATDDQSEDLSGIEEIKLVRAAVGAFKRRKNLKKLREEQRKRLSRGKKFDSLVDQIMRIRDEEDAMPKPLSKSAKRILNQNGINHKQQQQRRGSRTSDGSGSTGGSRPTSRPESVAQRVLRERQEKKITTRIPSSKVIHTYSVQCSYKKFGQ